MASPDVKNTRERLFLAAVKVFAEQGFEKATVREICRLAGAANLNAVNYYFGGKQNLYRAILEVMFTAFEKRLKEACANQEPGGPEERLRVVVASYCTMIYGSGEIAAEMCAIFMREMLRPSLFLNEMAEKHSRHQVEKFLEMLSEILGPNTPADVLRECAVSIFGQIAYYVFAWPLFNRLFPEHPAPGSHYGELAEHIVRFSLGGLKATKSALLTTGNARASGRMELPRTIAKETCKVVQESSRFETMSRADFRSFLEGIGGTTLDGRPCAASRTAFITAFMRAYHSANETPKVFDDGMAARLLTPDEYAFFQEMYYRKTLRDRVGDPILKTGRPSILTHAMRGGQVASVLCRARFAEETLEKEVFGGIRQYIILGAGFDTFALRRPDLLVKISVIEVDHAATQAVKLRRLAEMGFVPPTSLHFVSVDFSKENLPHALSHSVFDPALPAFFSCLGVTYYLEKRDLLNVLRGLSESAAPGSVLAFDYLHADAFHPDAVTPQAQELQEKLRSLGEPMKTGLDPAVLDKELLEVGWRLRCDLSPTEIHERYFRECAEELRPGRYLHLALAESSSADQ